MYAPTRSQARQFMFEVWRKYQAGEPLTGLETTALDVILMHPEYHGLLAEADRHLDRDYSPQEGSINPFLHLNLHLAIEEQLSIDQPRGVVERYRRLNERLGVGHEAKHALLECLGEMLWDAQRNGQAPDERVYFECLDRKSGRGIRDPES
jgi:hypothetical protein